jgi:GT2 family glycosyltransferase
MTDPLISFVVPLFNHVEHSRKMLATLLNSLPRDLRFEILFADDESTDETREWLSSLNDPRIRYTLNERNLGYAKTNNGAAKLTKGHFLGLLNNDLLFEPGWFEPMLAVIDDPLLNAGIVGNLQYRVADKALDHAGVALMPSGKFEHINTAPDIHTLPIPVYAVTGACMLMRRTDFEAAGGFDEAFLNGCEDIDLCLNIRSLGKQIYVAPNSQILHHVSLSRSSASLQNEKNSQYLYVKWRKEFKLKLIKIWIELLDSSSTNFQNFIDGILLPSFRSKRHSAAIAIAEAALLREEARWHRELGNPASFDGWFNHVSVSGVTEVKQLKKYLANSQINIYIDKIKTAQNFYVCARLLDDFDAVAIEIEVSVNDAQKKIFRLNDGRVINVGIINPIIFPGQKNHFKAEIYFIDADGTATKPAPNAILISHFVIDDKVIMPDQITVEIA